MLGLDVLLLQECTTAHTEKREMLGLAGLETTKPRVTLLHNCTKREMRNFLQ